MTQERYGNYGSDDETPGRNWRQRQARRDLQGTVPTGIKNELGEDEDPTETKQRLEPVYKELENLVKNSSWQDKDPKFVFDEFDNSNLLPIHTPEPFEDRDLLNYMHNKAPELHTYFAACEALGE